MAERKPRRAAPKRLFAGGNPEPVADLRAAEAEPDAEDRRDGPTPGPGRPASSGGGSRRAVGPGLTPNTWQSVIAAVCCEAFWESAALIQCAVDEFDHERRGRRRENTAADMLAYCVTELNCGGMHAADREIRPDPHAGIVSSLWDAAREALARAWPDHAERRLSPKPVNRTKYHNFRERFLTGDTLDQLGSVLAGHAVKAAIDTGLLNPGAGSHARPHSTQLIYGDGTWIPAMHNRNDDTRRDPDATDYYCNDGSKADAPGHLVVRNYVRGTEPNSRITLSADIKDPAAGPKSDARIAVDRVLDMCDRHPKLRKGAKGFVYDMALRSAEHDDLLDAGVMPLSRTPKTANGRPAARNLGKHTFKVGDNTAELDITAIDGAPTIALVDGDGNSLAVPLQGHLVKPRPPRERLGRTAIYREWHIPCHDCVPPELQGATTRIRHNSTDAERNADPHRRRTTALRVFPSYDPVMVNNYGIREDSESSNNHTKSMFPNRRANAIGRSRLFVKLLAVQLHDLVTALLNHAKRNSGDMSRWFGQHLAHTKPASDGPHDGSPQHPRDGPLPTAA